MFTGSKYSKYKYIYEALSYSVNFIAPASFEIHSVRQYLVNSTGVSDIVNTTVYKTRPIFPVLGMANYPNF